MMEDTRAGISINADRAIRKIVKIVTDLDPDLLLGLIGQRELNWVNKNFKEAGTEVKWPALSPNTIASRRAGSLTQGTKSYRGQQLVGSATGSGAQPLRDTGRLAQSFMFDVTNPVVSIGTQSNIAKFHHEGTGPFTIRPKTKRALAFMTAGGPVARKSVRHPGIPRRPLLPSKQVAQMLALETARGMIAKAIRDADIGAGG